MATTKTNRLNLAKQAAGDNPGTWEVDLNTGFDDADARLFRSGPIDPVSVSETADYKGQCFFDTSTKLWWTATSAGAPGTWSKDFDIIDPLVTHPTTFAEDYPHGHLVAILDNPTTETVRLRPLGGSTIYVDISGGRETKSGDLTWDISNAAHREAAQTEDASTPYYLYIDNLTTPGTLEPIISKTPPDDWGGTKPGYHPTLADHRCVGSVWNDAGSNLVPTIWGPGGIAQFLEHDADHNHTLIGTASTSWRNEPVNVPVTASGVIISSACIILGASNGAIFFAADGAVGTIPAAQITPITVAMKNTLMYSNASAGDNTHSLAVQGELPIKTPATPAISYVSSSAVLNFHMVVTGYRDKWAPK